MFTESYWGAILRLPDTVINVCHAVWAIPILLTVLALARTTYRSKYLTVPGENRVPAL